jgi:S1-C subfamily serine protease
MRKVAGYVAVALLASSFTWWFAGLSSRPLPAAPPATEPPLDLIPVERVAVEVYKKVNRGVVHINTRSIGIDDWGLTEARDGSGSGSVLDTQGHIVTNYHVIEDARQISVTLYDGSAYQAKLVGSDANSDLAVLQIDAPRDKLYPIAWGNSKRLLVGMQVYAIGNPFGLDRTLTTGVVSSLNRSLRTENHREIKDVIQTDAAINPGNSGGPLLNHAGQMIGITTAIIGRANQNSGIGMAIPGNGAKRIVEELIRNGRIRHGDSGIVAVFQTDQGLLISRLDPDGPAAKAGLRGPQVRTIHRGGLAYRYLDRSKADLIVGVDGQSVKTVEDLLGPIESKRPGDKVVFQIIRDGKTRDVTVELTESTE